jgi:hypothetical protein
MAKKKRDSLARLRRLAATGGAARQASNPEVMDRLRSLGVSGSAPFGRAGSDGAFGTGLDRLGDIGLGVMKTLSVPGAAIGTTLANIADPISRSLGGQGVNYSWKNAAGAWRKGWKGYEGILEGAGSDNKTFNKLAGLGMDIVVDPLWLAAPVKVLGAATKADGGLKALKGLDDAAEVAVRPNQSVRAATDALHPRGRFVSRIRDRKYKPFKGRVKGTVIGRRAGDKAVGDQYLAFRLGASNKKGAADRFGLVELRHSDEGLEWTAGSRVLDETFSSVDDAAAHARSLLDSGDRLIKLDRAGLPKAGAFDDMLRGISESETSRLTERTKLGVKLGIGKANPAGGKGLSGMNYTLRTGMKVPTKSMQTHKLGRVFKRDPVEKIAHREITAFNDYRQAQPIMQRALREAFPTMDDAQAEIVGLIAAADNASFRGVEGQQLLGSDVLKPLLAQEGKWSDDMERALLYARERFGDYWNLERPGAAVDEVRGPYAPQGPAEEGLQRMMAHFRNQEKIPEDARIKVLDRMNKFGTANAEMGRSFETAFAYRTQEEWRQALRQMGLDGELADVLVARIGQHLNEVEPVFQKLSKRGSKAKVNFAEESLSELEDEVDRLMLGLGPELNIFTMISRREIAHARIMLTKQIEELAKAAQLSDEAEKYLLTRVRTEDIPGAFGATPVGRFLRRWVPQYKSLLTTLNQAHFPNNAAGDFFNALVTGNIRHANPMNLLKVNFGVTGSADAARGAKGAPFWRLAAGDDEMLKRTFQIGAHEYTGYEVFMLSHMMGLGKGYVGADIGDFINLYEQSRNPLVKFRDFMQRQNMNREDAQRMHTWFLHLQSGDDPFTAMAKTLRVHFDYNDLTDFERVVLRNSLLFYTWFKKNLILQWTGVATKPGLYSAYGDVERERPRFANEPPYMSQQGALPIPGYGNLLMGAPWSDLYKADFTEGPAQGVKSEILASLAPQFKVPLELTMGEEFFSRRRIPNEPKSAGDWAKLAQYFANQAGPVPGTVNKLVNPGTSDRDAIDNLTQVLGVGRRQVDDPEKFARLARFYGGS